jgi:hypothetical protein
MLGAVLQYMAGLSNLAVTVKSTLALKLLNTFGTCYVETSTDNLLSNLLLNLFYHYLLNLFIY